MKVITGKEKILRETVCLVQDACFATVLVLSFAEAKTAAKGSDHVPTVPIWFTFPTLIMV